MKIKLQALPGLTASHDKFLDSYSTIKILPEEDVDALRAALGC
ncbi:hypothetical protein [Acidocella facilis]|nr:hypothetical protein [Acidocella facilis]